MKLGKEEEETTAKAETQCGVRLLILTEAALITGAIPAAILFILSCVTNIILLVDQDEYDTCIATKKAQKVLAGGSSGDVSDMLEWHLTGSIICAYVFLIIYGQILFSPWKFLYKYSGLLLVVLMVLMVAFQGVAVVWAIDNDCDSTNYFYLALANNIIQVILYIFTLTVVFLMFWWAKTSNDGNKVRQEENKDGKKTEIPDSKEAKRSREGWNTERKDGEFISKFLYNLLQLDLPSHVG